MKLVTFQTPRAAVRAGALIDGGRKVLEALRQIARMA